MDQAIRLDHVEFASVRATERTEWTFATVFDNRGQPATVEITCGDATGDVVKRFTSLMDALKGKGIPGDSHVVSLLGLSESQLRADRALATAISGIRTALVELKSRYDGLSVTEALGGESQRSVALYANINRSLFGGDRTPEAFGAAAERAVRSGFAIVKCAPFDEVRPPATAGEILDIARPGLDRVAAVRRAVGPDVGVLVDCHSRFEAHTAPLVAEELARLNAGWFEEPLQPVTDPEGLALVASKVTMPVAGGESGYGETFFADLVNRGAVSIVMPDVKHCGGVAEAFRAGRAAMDAGGHASLHSPSGPISQLASAHVTAAMSGAMALEHAVNEVPWRADLQVPPERIEGGRLWFSNGNGLGATLNVSRVNRYGRRWKP